MRAFDISPEGLVVNLSQSPTASIRDLIRKINETPIVNGAVSERKITTMVTEKKGEPVYCSWYASSDEQLVTGYVPRDQLFVHRDPSDPANPLNCHGRSRQILFSDFKCLAAITTTR